MSGIIGMLLEQKEVSNRWGDDLSGLRFNEKMASLCGPESDNEPTVRHQVQRSRTTQNFTQLKRPLNRLL